MLQEILIKLMLSSSADSQTVSCDPKSIKVGRKLINDKSTPDNLVDYVKKALQKLGISSNQVIFKALFTLRNYI